MNTNQLKPFAQKARNIIRDGVTRQLIYWGFDEKGIVQCKPEKVEGGVIHREQVIDDPMVLKQWDALHSAVKHQGFDQVVEEAAYTWFNRLMAIRILAKNSYDISQLEYGNEGAQTPLILQRARRGQFAFLNREEQNRLNLVLTDYTQDAKAFAILITGYCHSHTLLNNVFGRMDDFTEMLLPADMLSETGFIHFLNTTDAISDEDYQKVELIGWLYQFYISEKKDKVFKQFKKNQKAEAKDIPAATQIFTPNWIVKYMVENTVGRIWLDKNPDSPIKASMKYLVESPQENEAQQKTPLISEVAQLKLLDPASGSGHILVEGFELLYQMYLEEYYMPDEAVESILKNNLFGLDIDLRAAQLAQFAILMKAAGKHPEILKKNILPRVYAMPAPADFSRQEILDFLGDEGRQYEEKLTDALQLMQQAQNLGSIMKFDFTVDERNIIVTRLNALKNQTQRNTYEEALLNKMAPFIEVLTILINQYEAIAANPPYMGSGNMNRELKQYTYHHYPLSKSDLFAIFMEVCLNMNISNGLMGMINQHSWMFLSSFEELRKEIISKYGIRNMLHLGSRTFEELSGEVVQSTTFVIGNGNNIKNGTYFRLVDLKNNDEKELHFLNKHKQYLNISQDVFSKIPGTPIAYWVSVERLKTFQLPLKLDEVIFVDGQNKTGKNEKYLKFHWEISQMDIGIKNKFIVYAKGGTFRKWFGNIEHCVLWNDETRFFYKKNKIARIIKEKYWYRRGFTFSRLAKIVNGRGLDERGTFDATTVSFFLNEDKYSHLYFYLLGFFNSKVFDSYIKIFNPTLVFQLVDVRNTPLIINHIEKIEEISKFSISSSKKDWNNRETSFDFKMSPLLNGNSSLKYSYDDWLKYAVQDFYQLQLNEEKANAIFIDIYGLNEEIEPQVPLQLVTILQEELDAKRLKKIDVLVNKKRNWKLIDNKWQLFDDENIELPPLPIKQDVVMKQFISYAIGCMMGRYRLDKPGLQIAHPNPSPEEVCTYSFNGHTFEIDDDAIIPLMGSACTFPDDAVNRFNQFLEIVWGADTLTNNKNFLVECLNQEIEKYLVKDFWKDHCKTYKKKPIYWLFSSEKGAFQVLVYMHRMNRFTVEKIRSKYLLKHLQFLQQEKDRLEDNSANLSRDELKQLDTIRGQYTECERFEMVLKDYADRQIEFDLDNGVTVNYELFKEVVAPIK